MGFPDWWGKTREKTQKQKTQTSGHIWMFTQKPIQKQTGSEIRTWIFEWWVGGDKSSISGSIFECWRWRWHTTTVKPSRGSSLASMEMRRRGFSFFVEMRTASGWLFRGSSLASMVVKSLRRVGFLVEIRYDDREAVDLLWQQWSWGRRGFAIWEPLRSEERLNTKG